RSGTALELTGLIISQISRLCLGRRFGLLPANRGIVTGGCFRVVRHPIFAGWLLLTIGFTMANLSACNLLVVFLILPFMMKRIDQEETLLMGDPSYRAYMQRVRYRLIPGLY
ncbi:MAG: isoprenylcysteine carboxylmethyltransferase family protein, partial [Candidatus Binataceae bacterium]